MAELIKMPRLSDTMEEGTVATWFKKVGDKVEEGDILAEIETDKATMEFESFYEGTLLYIGIKENETAEVDAPLAIIGDPSEDIDSILNNSETKNLPDENPAENNIEKDVQPTNEQIEEDIHMISMPRLSDTMEEGTVATWFKKVGDKVEEGDILAEIETDKATMEFEAFYSGTLLHVGLNEGDSAKVDSLLAIIGPEGTDISSHLNRPDKKAEVIKEVEVKKPEVESKNIDEGVQSKPNQTKVDTTNRIFISPLAKKLATERNIDINLLKGSGENGRIIKYDIENYKEPVKENTYLAPSQDTDTISNEDFYDVKHSQMRKVIAKRLTESKFSAPHYYLNVEVDMSETIVFRKQCNSIPDTKISFNDIIIKACAVALRNNPSVNSSWFEDKIRYNNYVNIGVAVGVDDGLVVPVLKNADKMAVADISRTVKEMAGLARDKKLTPEMMQGSTFTISNLGMFGIESFTSIINSPNSVILSVGSIIEKPVVKDGSIVIGNTMKLTLACDHRVVDGLTGAKFLQSLKPLIENPLSMLI